MMLLFVKKREGVEDDRDDDHEEHLAGNKALSIFRTGVRLDNPNHPELR